MSKFMICPISAEESFNSFEEAQAQALTLTEKVKEAKGFIVYEVRELGRFEAVSPVWVDNKNDAGWREPGVTGYRAEAIIADDPHSEVMPAPRLKKSAIAQAMADKDDEIPF